jgi:hypothetical protein
MTDWVSDARKLFDESYERDWTPHVRDVNERLRLVGDSAFLEVPTAPEFFWGDLAAFVPHEWVAVISLNPQIMSAENLAWQQSQRWNADSLWQYLNRQDLRGFRPEDFYYRRFARPIVTLAEAALGIDDPMRDEVAVLMHRVGLFETVPYPSRVFALSTMQTSELARDDVGCRTALAIALTAIRCCPPAAVFVNGIPATQVFGLLAGDAWEWREQRYPSVSNARKWLRHFEGAFESEDGKVPVFGLPHLRTQSSHNSTEEIGQLASRITEVVGGG